MNLQEFVKSALVELVSGVEDARKVSPQGAIPQMSGPTAVEFEVSLSGSAGAEDDGEAEEGGLEVFGGETAGATVKFKLFVQI